MWKELNALTVMGEPTVSPPICDCAFVTYLLSRDHKPAPLVNETSQLGIIFTILVVLFIYYENRTRSTQ